MTINETIFNISCLEIIQELQQQLQLNHINLLQVITDTPDNVMVACPYHKGGQEKRPSMGIKKSDGTCHCFACDTVVGLPHLISHCFGDESEIGATGWQWLLKNFLTVRGGIMVDNYQFKDLPYTFSYWAFGAEYGRQSIVGPLKIAFQWCNISGFTGYASIGFDF